MRTKISYIIILPALVMAAVSCKKNSAVPAPALSPADVYIREAALTDTLSQSVSVEKDSIIILRFRAALKDSGTVMSGTHAVAFAIDTTQIAAYRSKYGPATLLPSSNYLLAFNTSMISDTGSSPVLLTIGATSLLPPGTTYVLPLVIKSIDRQPLTSLGSKQVFYLIVKTLPIDYGVPIDKSGWNIVSFSSQTVGDAASNALDNNIQTPWASALGAPMPQYVVIDMGQQYNLKAVTFNNWSGVAFGANPTQVMIELSTDNSTWMNAGTFSGGQAITGALHQLKIKPTTPARYIRFTVLQATTYAGFNIAAVSEIGAND